MNLQLDDEQRLLHDSVVRWVTARSASDAGASVSRERWAEMAGFGWLAMTLPAAHEGLGQGLAEACVLAQALGPLTGEGARFAPAEQLSNATKAQPTAATGQVGEPVVASIYQLDGMVRRATSLQLTADARSLAPMESQEVSA